MTAYTIHDRATEIHRQHPDLHYMVCLSMAREERDDQRKLRQFFEGAKLTFTAAFVVSLLWIIPFVWLLLCAAAAHIAK